MASEPTAKSLTEVITTRRLRLHLLDMQKDSDIDWWLSFRSHSDITQTMGDLNLRSRDDCRAIMESWKLNRDLYNGYHGVGIYFLSLVEIPDVFIGFVSLRQTLRIPDLGYGLLSPYWGRGYATEAATELLRYARQDIGLREVIGYTMKGNGKSQNVLRKIGFVDCPSTESEKGGKKIDVLIWSEDAQVI
ncbi:acyl-CoA N-acyltransferase [Xylogone sp. PMI_703]|nr:acyl-CoA N-acyltransferase [Xylogone sp. PMI_703]